MSQDKAQDVWELFHAKDARELIKVPKGWPKQWGLAGRCLRSFYRSDKWNRDGDFDDYYHDHGSEIYVYEPWGVEEWLVPSDPPIKRFPASGAVLGYSLGWILERVDDGKTIEAEMYEDTYLCADPEGLYLFTVEPSVGVTALFCGSGLHIKDVGIVG